MEKLLKKEFHTLTLKTRDRLGLTQSKMADRYVMAESSYNALEKGEYKCGTLTTVLLLQDQDAPEEVLDDLLKKFKKIRTEEMIST